MPLWRCAGANNKDGLRLSVIEGGGRGGRGDGDTRVRQGGAQDKAGNDEALGLVGLLGHVGVVGAHG